MVLRFRIFKMISTSGLLIDLECTKFVFGRGSAPGPAGEAYSAPPGPLAGLRSPISKGQEEGRNGERGDEGEKTGKGKRERERGREGPPPSFRKFLDPPLV